MSIKAWNISSVARVLRNWRPQAPVWGRGVLDLLFPPRCAFCDADLLVGENEVLLCKHCQSELAPADWPSCQRCGAKAPAGESPDRCHLCKREGFQFDSVLPLGAYCGSLREAVLQMKRSGGEPLSAAMGRLYFQRKGAGLVAFRPDLVVPVPMHWKRRLVRKTNSPELVARPIAAGLRVPVRPTIVRRSRNTRPQKDLPPRQRRENLRGAFELVAGYDLKGARVVLVDDILTTGATCHEAAKVLKRGGAAAVFVAVLARAEGEDRP